jgi:hypothetical protein
MNLQAKGINVHKWEMNLHAFVLFLLIQFITHITSTITTSLIGMRVEIQPSFQIFHHPKFCPKLGAFIVSL